MLKYILDKFFFIYFKHNVSHERNGFDVNVFSAAGIEIVLNIYF